MDQIIFKAVYLRYYFDFELHDRLSFIRDQHAKLVLFPFNSLKFFVYEFF